jgi:hypothetical protein
MLPTATRPEHNHTHNGPVVEEPYRGAAQGTSERAALCTSHGLRTNVPTLSRGEENSFFAQDIRETGEKRRTSTCAKAG